MTKRSGQMHLKMNMNLNVKALSPCLLEKVGGHWVETKLVESMGILLYEPTPVVLVIPLHG